jgi:flavodoxin
MVLPKTLLIIYYSNTGKTEKMALQLANGAEKAGVNAILKKVEDCTLDDLAEADGIAVGSPTHYAIWHGKLRDLWMRQY